MRVEISAEKSFHFQALDRSAPLLLPGCTWMQGRREKPREKVQWRNDESLQKDTNNQALTCLGVEKRSNWLEF